MQGLYHKGHEHYHKVMHTMQNCSMFYTQDASVKVDISTSIYMFVKMTQEGFRWSSRYALLGRWNDLYTMYTK